VKELGKTELSGMVPEVAGRLSDYCAINCVNPRDCDTCPLREARDALARIGLAIYLPELTATLEPEEDCEVEAPCRHPTVIRGGRR
jgi:hypothetical protein